VGLQRKSVEKCAHELGLPTGQTHAFLNNAIRHLSAHFDELCREAIVEEEDEKDEEEVEKQKERNLSEAAKSGEKVGFK
jgi:hypothetical protein